MVKNWYQVAWHRRCGAIRSQGPQGLDGLLAERGWRVGSDDGEKAMDLHVKVNPSTGKSPVTPLMPKQTTDVDRLVGLRITAAAPPSLTAPHPRVPTTTGAKAEDQDGSRYGRCNRTRRGVQNIAHRWATHLRNCENTRQTPCARRGDVLPFAAHTS